VCISVARAFQPELLRPVDFDRVECSVSRATVPLTPDPLPRFTGARGGLVASGQLPVAGGWSHAKPRRARREPQGSMFGVRCSCSVQASRGRESAGVHFSSSGFPARALRRRFMSAPSAVFPGVTVPSPLTSPPFHGGEGRISGRWSGGWSHAKPRRAKGTARARPGEGRQHCRTRLAPFCDTVARAFQPEPLAGDCDLRGPGRGAGRWRSSGVLRAVWLPFALWLS
jgi:hypothetical protein